MPTAEGFALHLRHEIVVARPIEAVFDVATTARHWTVWHPATVRVDGQIAAPARRAPVVGGLEALAALLEREISEPEP
jgi:hypothetical protein